MVRQRRFVLPLYYKQVIVWAGLGWVPRQSNRFWVVDMPSVLDSATNSPEVPLVAVASFQPPPSPSFEYLIHMSARWNRMQAA
jgi:hypothetical protein